MLGSAAPTPNMREISAAIVLKRLPIDDNARTMDFGVGIGRVALAVLRKRPKIRSLIGVDIVPRVVEFCREKIGAHFPNTSFELLADQNQHYERLRPATKRKRVKC